MRRKTIWMPFLLSGFNLGLILSLGSCDEHTEYGVTGTFLYVNETDHRIQVQSIKPFDLEPYEQFAIEEIGRGSEKVSTAEDYVPPFLDAVLLFDSAKCDTLNTLLGTGLGEGPEITGIQNYTSEQLDKRHFKFTYTFTEADYDAAEDCE